MRRLLLFLLQLTTNPTITTTTTTKTITTITNDNISNNNKMSIVPPPSVQRKLGLRITLRLSRWSHYSRWTKTLMHVHSTSLYINVRLMHSIHKWRNYSMHLHLYSAHFKASKDSWIISSGQFNHLTSRRKTSRSREAIRFGRRPRTSFIIWVGFVVDSKWPSDL